MIGVRIVNDSQMYLMYSYTMLLQCLKGKSRDKKTRVKTVTMELLCKSYKVSQETCDGSGT